MAGTDATALNYLYQQQIGDGGVSLQAAGLVTASAQGTAVTAGRGWYKIVCTVSAVEVASNDERYAIDIEANTSDATTTWKRLATVLDIGALEVTGRQADDTTGTYVAAVFNPNDYQIRACCHVLGTVGTGFNCVVKAYPLVA